MRCAGKCKVFRRTLFPKGITQEGEWNIWQNHCMKKSINICIKKIQKHEYEEGEKLPTESELSDFFQSSKAPVRQALEKLGLEGFIVRRPGKGTYVAVHQPGPI